MGKWFCEEVAGDRYIFDSDTNPVILGCPQGAPVFVIHGEDRQEAKRACAAHNADRERLTSEITALHFTVAQLENEHSDRLKAVLEYLRENAEAQCDCEFNRDGERRYHCEFCQDYEAACRIAEGEG